MFSTEIYIKPCQSVQFKDEIPYNTKDDTQSITAQEQVQTRSMQVTGAIAFCLLWQPQAPYTSRT